MRVIQTTQPHTPLACPPLSPSNVSNSLLKMHDITMRADIQWLWMAAVRAVPQTLLVFGALCCAA